MIFDANPIGATALASVRSKFLRSACSRKRSFKTDRDRGLQRYDRDHAMAADKQIFEKGESTAIVGVVGSGRGFFVRGYLARLGHDVTVYERREKPGGLDIRHGRYKCRRA